jgi:acetyl-CoA C-acetyltransferase
VNPRSPVDPHAPVLIGAGQLSQRDRSLELSPLELMVRAARLAGEDPAARRLLERTESVGIVDCLSWPVADPGALVADALSLRPAETARTLTSGTGPIELLAEACARIQAGRLDVALIAGAEAINPFMRATREARSTGWPEQPLGSAPTRLLGADRAASHDAELAAGLLAPLHYYPWFENALRAAAERTVDEHRRWLAELWERFAQVARSNPHAWTQETPSAEEILTPSPGNRMAAFPYTKLMTANIQVDQGAALLVCSARAAEEAGIARERWVFVHASAAAHDHWFAASRRDLHRSPAVAACAGRSLAHAGIGVDDVAHLDLYSCFPSAVQIAAAELGVDLANDSRPPTVTGGLSFAGGPGSNYATHSLAAMSGRLRENPGAYGLITGVGWYMTKHANAILSTDPPSRPYAHLNPQAEVDALPRRRIAPAVDAEAPIESYTVVFDRDGAPSRSIVSGLLTDGSRALASSADRETADSLLGSEGAGRWVRLSASGEFRLASAS